MEPARDRRTALARSGSTVEISVTVPARSLQLIELRPAGAQQRLVMLSAAAGCS